EDQNGPSIDKLTWNGTSALARLRFFLRSLAPGTLGCRTGYWRLRACRRWGVIRIGVGACGGTVETVLSGLPARPAWLPARFSRSPFVDREGAAGQGCAVEGVHRRLRRAVVRHLDEVKAP